MMSSLPRTDQLPPEGRLALVAEPPPDALSPLY